MQNQTKNISSFGMLMPNRAYNSGEYRFGFNDKENDNELKGVGNQQDYGMRIYDPRLNRFLSVDPLTDKYVYYSPYQFAGNKPIYAIDLDGLEDIDFMSSFTTVYGNTSLERVSNTVTGQIILDKFQNTDPNCGPVNNGYNILIRGTPTEKTGLKPNQGHLNLIIDPDQMDFDLDEKDEAKPREVNTLNLMIKYREKKDSKTYAYLVKLYGEDVVNNPEIDKTAKEKRGLIVINIDTKLSEKGAAKTFGHEIGAHATLVATDKDEFEKQTEAEQHKNFKSTDKKLGNEIDAQPDNK